MSLKADTAREYRKKYGKQKPTRALARIVYNENKKLFIDPEDARDSLRYIEGKRGGGADRKRVKESEHFSSEPRPLNPYKLPPSDETAYEPYIIKGHKKIALFSDIHIPYHSIQALTATIDFIKKEKPDALLLNGDSLDFHGLSKFQRDPRKKNFKQELDTWKAMFDVFSKVLKCKIYYKLGNHEERYEHYLWQKHGELAGVEEFELENILKARAKGIEIIKDKRIIKANKLNIVHGHEFGGSVFSPVNIARGLYNKGKACAIQGHNHQISEHTEPDMNGNVVTTWSAGCLCELHPSYLPLNKWAHGFAIIELDTNKIDFHVRNKRISKGKVL